MGDEENSDRAMSHTPGPWETREGGAEVFGSAIYTLEAHDLDPLAAVDHLDPNVEADARLIASAPELLEALDHISGHAAQGYYMCGTEEEWLDGLRAARALVAKVRGSLTPE